MIPIVSYARPPTCAAPAQAYTPFTMELVYLAMKITAFYVRQQMYAQPVLQTILSIMEIVFPVILIVVRSAKLLMYALPA